MTTTATRMTKLADGTRVQLNVNVGGSDVRFEVKTGTVTRRESVGFYLVRLEGETCELGVHRVDMTVLPATEYLSAEERAVVSARKIALKLEKIKACPERECRAGFTCAAHREV